MTIDLCIPYTPTVLVVAHGEIYDDAETLRLIKVAQHIVVCDGALGRYLELSSRRPDMVIGDGDSVNPADLEQIGAPFTRVEEQETNDLTKAVTFALARGWREIAIVGATGRREDHTLGNIFLLPDYYKNGAAVRLYSLFGIMIPFEGAVTIETEVGRELSVFAVEAKPMSARGVAYPFEERTFTALWQATLNQVIQPTVELWSEGMAILFISNEKRN
ncbi:MAG: thiamine diphosphokinase [Bacteroidales bacterium]|uniref:thiamine diphosphokinase n=1 Tax=Porphyromonas sp. TaxID=1924944 RepID=UPI0029720743|nr:thiamine diphosphokinase [Porphyromonas sp.]MDD7438640.1 thiamine diphosphokinase [Bacteroidales bacterium]MDY3067896.1 thiamine diphosphokinase [Porphyromonas sp.]